MKHAHVLIALGMWLCSSQAMAKEATLQDLIQIAFSSNPTILSARYGLDSARAASMQARATLFPQVSATLGYNRSVTSSNIPPASGLVGNTFSANLNLSQMLFDGGRTLNAMTQAGAGEEQAAANYRQARQSVSFSVKQGYYSLIAAQLIVKAREKSVMASSENLKAVQARVQMGQATRSDLLQAQADLANAEFSALQARINAKSARLTLANALGRPRDPLPEIAEQLAVQLINVDEEAALKQALQDRSELQGLRANIRALEQSVTFAYFGYGPTVNFVASEAWQDTETTPAARSSGVWSIGVQLSQPLFNGFLTSGQVEAAKAAVDSLRAKETSTVQSIITAVRQAILTVRETEEQIRVAKAALAASQASFDVQRGQYKYGLVSQLQVTTARASLATAEINLVQAQAAYLQALAQLDQAVGRE